jgi:hypothetical protein
MGKYSIIYREVKKKLNYWAIDLCAIYITRLMLREFPLRTNDLFNLYGKASLTTRNYTYLNSDTMILIDWF